MIAILSYRMEHDCHTLLLKSATKRLKMGNSLPHFLLKTAILSFYLHPVLFFGEQYARETTKRMSSFWRIYESNDTFSPHQSVINVKKRHANYFPYGAT